MQRRITQYQRFCNIYLTGLRTTKKYMLSSITHRKTEETHVKTGKLKYIHVLAYFSNFCFITVTQNSKFISPVALQVCLTLAIRQTWLTFLV